MRVCSRGHARSCLRIKQAKRKNVCSAEPFQQCPCICSKGVLSDWPFPGHVVVTIYDLVTASKDPSSCSYKGDFTQTAEFSWFCVISSAQALTAISRNAPARSMGATVKKPLETFSMVSSTSRHNSTQREEFSPF